MTETDIKKLVLAVAKRKGEGHVCVAGAMVVCARWEGMREWWWI